MAFNLRTSDGAGFNLRTGMSGMEDISAESITSGTIAVARLPTLSKTSIDNAGTWGEDEIPDLNAGKLTTGTLLTQVVPELPKTKIADAETWGVSEIPVLPKTQIDGQGSWAESDIPLLAKSKIADAQTWDVSDIPDLDAAKITAGEFDALLIPDLDASKLTSGVLDSARIPATDLLATSYTFQAASSTITTTPEHLFRGTAHHTNLGTGSPNTTQSHHMRFGSHDIHSTSTLQHSALSGASTAYPNVVFVDIPQGWRPTSVFVSQHTTSATFSEAAQTLEVVEVGVRSLTVSSSLVLGSPTNLYNHGVMLTAGSDFSLRGDTQLLIKIGSLTNSGGVPIFYNGGTVNIEQIT